MIVLNSYVQKPSIIVDCFLFKWKDWNWNKTEEEFLWINYAKDVRLSEKWSNWKNKYEKQILTFSMPLITFKEKVKLQDYSIDNLKKELGGVLLEFKSEVSLKI